MENSKSNLNHLKMTHQDLRSLNAMKNVVASTYINQMNTMATYSITHWVTQSRFLLIPILQVKLLDGVCKILTILICHKKSKIRRKGIRRRMMLEVELFKGFKRKIRNYVCGIKRSRERRNLQQIIINNWRKDWKYLPKIIGILIKT